MRVECVDIEWQFSLSKNLVNFDLPCLSVVDILDQVLLGSLVEDILDGVLLRDGSDLFVLLLVGLFDLLRAILVHLGDILDDQLAVRVDCLVDDALGIIIGLVNDLVDLLLLLQLSLSDLQIFLNRVLRLELFKALLDLLHDRIGAGLSIFMLVLLVAFVVVDNKNFVAESCDGHWFSLVKVLLDLTEIVVVILPANFDKITSLNAVKIVAHNVLNVVVGRLKIPLVLGASNAYRMDGDCRHAGKSE